MPCNSDHLKQTPREAGLQLAAKLAAHVATKVSVIVPPRILMQDKYYAEDAGQTEWLCEVMRDHRHVMTFDILNRMDRALIDWWEDHQKVDVTRILKASALAKLTPEERKALGYG